jgi:spermidine/putrescine transport system substrate-binding protein
MYIFTFSLLGGLTMLRRFFTVLFVVLIMPMLVIAQDSSELPPLEPWVCPEGFEGQTLNIYNWSTYIAETTIPQFEEACGVTVTYVTYASNEDMLTRIRLGNPGYDVIFPGSYIIPVMIREELLIPLDLDALPNLANIRAQFLERDFDPDSEYSVPYLMSSLGVGYNTEVFPDGIQSWEQVWEHDGPVAWIDDPRIMLGIALDGLGYDPNSEDPDEIAEAGEYLLERSDNVVTIAEDDGQAILQRGDVDLAIEYGGDIYQVIFECECDTYDYVLPEEGTNIEVDGVAIPVDAPNPELAMVFLDFIMSPQAAADIANYTGYGTTNQAAIDYELIDAEAYATEGIYPPEEILVNLFPLKEISDDAEAAYNDTWEQLLILIGS